MKAVKKKMDEVSSTLPSPMPSPDINAPSPEPDDDRFNFVSEKVFNTFKQP